MHVIFIRMDGIVNKQLASLISLVFPCAAEGMLYINLGRVRCRLHVGHVLHNLGTCMVRELRASIISRQLCTVRQVDMC